MQKCICTLIRCFCLYFVGTFKVNEGQFYIEFVDKNTTYGQDNFWTFYRLLDYSYKSIYMKWICDLYTS